LGGEQKGIAAETALHYNEIKLQIRRFNASAYAASGTDPELQFNFA
jgi:hypothetical protein